MSKSRGDQGSTGSDRGNPDPRKAPEGSPGPRGLTGGSSTKGTPKAGADAEGAGSKAAGAGSKGAGPTKGAGAGSKGARPAKGAGAGSKGAGPAKGAGAGPAKAAGALKRASPAPKAAGGVRPANPEAKAPRGARPPRPMPGGAEVLREQRRAARQAIPDPEVVADSHLGIGVIRSAWGGTAVFAVAAVVGALVPSTRLGVVGVDLLLLLVGSVLYFWGWAVAAGRSRDSEITLWNLILLEDAAPRRVRFQLLGALGVEVIVAAATCWITAALAFGWLVPLWGLAHCEYWGARYGTFLPRQIDPKGGRKTRRR